MDGNGEIGTPFGAHAPRRVYTRFLAMVLVALQGVACAASRGEPPLLAPAPGSPIALEGPGSIALGKVNEDEMLDVVVGGRRGITVLLGQGDGRVRPGPGSPIPLPGPSSEMELVDVDGDGHLDLALAHHDTYGVMLLFGDGKGGFTLAPHSPVVMREGQHPHTHGLDAGDLDGDGSLDLISVNSDDNDVSIAFGDGTGGFTRAASPFKVGPSPYPGALGDLDGDGSLDIISTTAARNAADGALTVLLGNGKGDFRGSPVGLRTTSPGFVAVADVNNDGRADLVTSHLERRELSILIGDGHGSFEEATGSPFDLGGNAWHLGIADMNGDGNRDVAAAVGHGVCVMLGDGHGGFEPAPRSPFPTGKGAWQLVVGDLNGDAKPDVITTDLESDTITILLAGS